ncbi:ABC transporter ATP-binding protein [Marinobacter vulgaris]|uniref:ABC transporter ATP-binding protein n=2 Tax=Marinobacter vulgaris TaxID=1928331 RepID=A0A2V3ZM33_9GAMM|nr:ABC transporter ATP-binding protein [Marinobacter vulgaris]PXX90724.1 ABC transporter ATP-binding protein [Marinobacter vulgaris]TSJ70304.1 ABC transporter ATP-binding protein [Marinobacter vulgaris]
MRSTFRKLFSILSSRERRTSFWMFVLIVIGAFFEAGGVASIIPFISVLSDPSVVNENVWLARAYAWSGMESVEAFTIAMGFLFLGVFFTSLVLKALNQWVQIRFSKMRVHSVGSRLLKGYLSQPYEWFLSRHTSKLATTILSEVNQVISKSLLPAIQLVAQTIVVTALIVVLLIIDPVLAVSSTAVLVGAYVVIYMVVRRPLYRFGRRRYLANLERYRVTQETLGGVKEVKVGCLEQNMLERFMPSSFKTANEEIKASVVNMLPGHFMQAVVFGGVVGVLLYLKQAYGSMSGALPVLSAFAFAAYRLLPALQQIFRHITSMRSNSAALDGLIAEIRSLESVSDSRLQEPRSRFPELKQCIKLKGIEYGYPAASEMALKGVSVTIGAKERIGLVGSSGSGKTTTVDVILGLLAPTSGNMFVDGVKITPENVRQWQRSIGYVPQHIFLADETIAANIAFGLKPNEIDRDSVIRAARLANLHDFITTRLPEGYDTEVGERGVRLSGGQRQRIGIARALYHDPDVLILDEATSALDNQTEKAVMEAVDKLASQKTIVLIAHRLSTVRECDRIYLMSDGQVVGEGRFDELVRDNAEFSAMASGEPSA